MQWLTLDDLLTVIRVAGKYEHTPWRIKAIQHHNDWLYETVQGALPEHDRFAALDPEYGADEYNSGKFPQIPVNAIGKLDDIRPTIFYHHDYMPIMRRRRTSSTWGSFRFPDKRGSLEHQEYGLCCNGCNPSHVCCT